LAETIAGLDGPVIVVGDFNATHIRPSIVASWRRPASVRRPFTSCSAITSDGRFANHFTKSSLRLC
jgi:endonuclease/exonuclease/phosphatase (EEP) superfamily protein YafD